jgi:Zn-dependent oligopeptidase
MPQLTKHVQSILDNFRQQIESLPEHERANAISEMIENLTSLNESVKAATRILSTPSGKQAEQDDERKIRDFL